MSNMKTPPIVGDVVIDEHKNLFLKKHGDDDGQITALKFWPAECVERTYIKASEALGTSDEHAALRTFYSEMVHYFRTATRMGFFMEEYDWILAFTEGVEV